jgi:hypothetical protein
MINGLALGDGRRLALGSRSEMWSIPGFMHTWFCVTQLRQVALL